MTSEQLKDAVVRKIISGSIDWITEDHQAQLESLIRMALYKLNLSEEEVGLSTEVRTPNEEYVKQYLVIKMVKGLSEDSIRAYTLTIRKFLAMVDKAIPDITSNDIRYYLAVRMTQDKVSKVTLDNERRHLRSFFATLNREELISNNPALKLDPIKVEKRRKEPFTEYEIEVLRKAVLTPGKKVSEQYIKRNAAIIEVLYSTGCRVSELVSMYRSKLKDGSISVIGKGDKERLVYLNPRAQIAIADYLALRSDTSDWLFLARGGNAISKAGVERMLRETGKLVGIEKCHPHRFRRTSATVALRRGMPIDQVSRMLGHEKLSTTQIYAITADEDVERNHRKYVT